MSDLRDWMHWEPTQKRHRLASLVLTPPRVIAGIGAAMAAIGSVLPWAAGEAPGHAGFEPVYFLGTDGAGDGLVLLLTALATGFLTLHHTPATSRVRTVRLLPAILVVLAAASLVNGYREAQAAIAAWEVRGGSAGLAPGLWLAAAGVVLMAIGTAWLLPEVLLRWRRAPDDPGDLVEVTPRGVAGVVLGIAGTLVGGALGISIALGMTATPVIGLITLGAVFGGLLGAYAGAWLARTMLA